MTYSQLFIRVVALAIAAAACWLLVADRLCLLSKVDGCRPIHGLPAVAIFLALLSIAAFLLVASAQPRRGRRIRHLRIALVAFLGFYLGAFLLNLFGAR